LAGVVIIDFA